MSWIYPLPRLLARHHQDVVWLVWPVKWFSIAQAPITLFAANLPRPIKPVPSHTWHCTAKTRSDGSAWGLSIFPWIFFPQTHSRLLACCQRRSVQWYCHPSGQNTSKFASEKIPSLPRPQSHLRGESMMHFSKFMMPWCPLIDGWILLKAFSDQSKSIPNNDLLNCNLQYTPEVEHGT